MQHRCINSKTRSLDLCNNELSGWKIKDRFQLVQLLICFIRPLQVVEVLDPDRQIKEGQPVEVKSLAGVTILTQQPFEIIFTQPELFWIQKNPVIFPASRCQCSDENKRRRFIYISRCYKSPIGEKLQVKNLMCISHEDDYLVRSLRKRLSGLPIENVRLPI